MSKKRSGWDTQKFQKRCAAVIAVVLCISLVLGLVAGLVAW